MEKIGKITPEQLRTALKILRELPVKDTRCSREEAAAFLEKDLKRAFRKGYTPKELCDLLKKARMIIPEHLIAHYQKPVKGPEVNRDRESEKQGSRDERNSMVTSRKLEEAEAVNAFPTPPHPDVSLKPKSEPARYGTFPIIRDTP